MTTTFDVGGLTVEVDGPGPLVEVVNARLGATASVDRPADVHLSFTPGAPRPARDPDATSTDAELWWDADGLSMAWRGVVAHQRSAHVVLAVEHDRVDDPDALDAVDLLTQYGVAAAAARPDQAVLHAAAVARDEAALVVIGSSGAGKSTLAAAAWTHGWSLLADDLVVVRRDGDRLTVRGIRRPPLLPHELLQAAPGAMPDARGRRRLPADVLCGDERRVAGVVIVGHDPAGGQVTVVEPAERVSSMVHGLALPPVAPVMATHLPMLAALGGLGLHRLGHARNAARRSARAAELLDEIGRRTGA